MPVLSLNDCTYHQTNSTIWWTITLVFTHSIFASPYGLWNSNANGPVTQMDFKKTSNFSWKCRTMVVFEINNPCHCSPKKVVQFMRNYGSGIPNMWLYYSHHLLVMWQGACRLWILPLNLPTSIQFDALVQSATEPPKLAQLTLLTGLWTGWVGQILTMDILMQNIFCSFAAPYKLCGLTVAGAVRP